MVPETFPPGDPPPRPAETRRRGSLGRRLTFLLAVLLIACGWIAAWASARGLGERLIDETQLGALRMADTVKSSTRFDMLHTRSEDVRQTVLQIGGQAGIEHVRIYNKEGRIVYSSHPEEEATIVDLTAEACYQCHAVAQPLVHLDSIQRARIYRHEDDGRVLAAIDVIYNEPGCSTAHCHASPAEQRVLGVVDVGISLSEIDARIAEAGASTLGFGVVATALICALVGVFVHSFVTRPVRGLLRGIFRVSGGDLEASLPVNSSDELGALAAAFNQMTTKLREAHGELRDWGEKLEHEVEERTRDLNRAQDQILRAEKMSSLGVLAAGVAHELNSPLTGILTFSHLLLQDTPAGTRKHEDLQLIVNETQRCAAIIRQLLQFSREHEPEAKPQDIITAVRRALALVERQSLFHSVKVSTHFEDGLPPVRGDANQLQQVFLNLLINAAEAMPNGGSITISVTRHSVDEVVIELTDTGTGIPPEHLRKIFDPFFTSKEVGKGTGLGLSVSYGIVRRHGGSITVSSVVGDGTTFTITFPAAVHASVES